MIINDENLVELNYDEEINSVGGASYTVREFKSTIVNVNAPRSSRIKNGGEIRLAVSFNRFAKQWSTCSLTRNVKC